VTSDPSGASHTTSPDAVGLWPRLRDLVCSLPEGTWRDLQEERLRRLRDRRLGRLEDLIALIEDEGVDVEGRVAACWFLGRLQEPEAMPALCRAMTHGPRPVRLAACYAAVDMDDRGAVPCLERALTGDPDAEVRKAAAYALGLVEGSRCGPLALGDPEEPRGDCRGQGYGGRAARPSAGRSGGADPSPRATRWADRGPFLGGIRARLPRFH
jgi:hypothetical protein